MIRIITDSLSDFTPEYAKEHNIDMLPLSINFGDETFLSGYEISNDAFYEKLVSSDEMPTTSQVNPFTFEEKFREYVDQGDTIITILFTKDLSGTFQSAVIAKETIDSDRIHLIDCRTGSLAEGVIVKNAIKMRDNGFSAEEIVEKTLELIKKSHIFIVLDTLEYLKKGGRISPSIAFVGGILGLHPIITINDGKVELIDKVKGKRSMNKWLIHKLDTLPVDTDYDFFIGHSNSMDNANEFHTLIKDREYGNTAETFCIGPVIGAHVGPNAIGIGYIAK